MLRAHIALFSGGGGDDDDEEDSEEDSEEGSSIDDDEEDDDDEDKSQVDEEDEEDEDDEDDEEDEEGEEDEEDEEWDTEAEGKPCDHHLPSSTQNGLQRGRNHFTLVPSPRPSLDLPHQQPTASFAGNR